MLILTQHPGDSIQIGGDFGNGDTLFDATGAPVLIEIIDLGVKGNQTRFGIVAKKSIPVHRAEIAHRIRAQQGVRHPKLQGYTGPNVRVDHRGNVDGNVAEPVADEVPADA